VVPIISGLNKSRDNLRYYRSRLEREYLRFSLLSARLTPKTFLKRFPTVNLFGAAEKLQIIAVPFISAVHASSHAQHRNNNFIDFSAAPRRFTTVNLLRKTGDFSEAQRRENQ